MTVRQDPTSRSASCAFCGRTMTTPNMIGDAPLHPDCFTRMCVAALTQDAPAWRWVPYLGWSFR